jgi:hypothetical protein
MKDQKKLHDMLDAIEAIEAYSVPLNAWNVEKSRHVNG